MSRTTVHALQSSTADDGGGPPGNVSPLSSPRDDLNRQIVRLLQDDGRAAYDVIAHKLGVSGGTIRNRIARMREAGMLRIVAVVDPVAVDYESDAMLGIKTAPGTAPAEVADRLGPHPAVVYIVWVSGRFDLLVEVVCDEESGLAAFLHGWHFDVDGTLLEAPSQPPEAEARLKRRVRLGAYPAFEYRGLVFAYLGPPEEMPEFPVYDTFELPDMEMAPYRAPFRCNWLQVLDAILDPVHTSFLHSGISREQFSAGLGEIGRIDFFDRDAWLMGTNTRRVGDHVWFRVNELVLPNFTQAGAAFATDGTRQRYYGRSAFVRWVVPIDDENTMALAWACFGERGDPPAWNTPEGPELIEQGEVFDRSYEQRQRFPGDAEAVEGMGRITVHDNEHLAPSDKGVALMRRRLREQVRAVAAGERPLRVTDLAPNPVPTCGGDSVVALPPPAEADADESERFSRLAHAFMQMQFDADGLPEPDRVAFVTEQLRALEANGGAVDTPLRSTAGATNTGTMNTGTPVGRATEPGVAGASSTPGPDPA